MAEREKEATGLRGELEQSVTFETRPTIGRGANECYIVRGTIALTLTQWLPKPATSQFPEKERSLREMWSPRRGDSFGSGTFFGAIWTGRLRRV